MPLPALLATLAGVGVAYYVSAVLSLRLSLVGDSVTPFWPPTGIAVVAFLVLGLRMWPAIAVGAFLVNLPISPAPWAAASIAAGNTLAPLVAVALLTTTGFHKTIDRLRDASSILLAALVSTLISASVGTTSLLLADAIDVGDFVQSWAVWWTGDAMGIFLVAPFLLTVLFVREPRIDRRNAVEAVGLFACLAAGAALMFAAPGPAWVLHIPLISLLAWRFQLRGAAPAALIMSTLATLAAANSLGPFEDANLLEKMLSLQAFNAAVSFTSLFLATVVTERERARRALESAAIDLEHVVERRTEIAETLQRSLLPERLPDIPDIEMSARYVPATSDLEIGGDWYDAISLNDGRVAIAIGDVAGHGIPAAATMGQLRMALRSYVLDVHRPEDVLRHLNLVLRDLQPGSMATVVYVYLDVESGEFSCANAGHPPPLLLDADGGASVYLEEALAPPLGAVPHLRCRALTGRLEPGARLILYTDGLVETRQSPIEEGLDRLRSIVAGAPDDLEGACDHVIAGMLRDTTEDDVALLIVRRTSFSGQRLSVTRDATPVEIPELRRVVRRWLTENGANHDESSDILIAFSEACTNVIQHAYGPQGGPLHVEAMIDDGSVVLTVSDDGAWRPAREGTDDGGRGLELMRATMDEVVVTPGADGTQVRARRALQTERTDG